MNWYKILGILASLATVVGLVYTFMNQPPPTEENDVRGVQINDNVEISGGNFAGRDNNFYYNSGGNSELINLLNLRAGIINDSLHQFYKYEKVKEYLDQFNVLHTQVIKALEKDQDVLAHELIGRIHSLSSVLEATELEKKDKAHNIDVQYEMIFQPDFLWGQLATEYISGNFLEVYELKDLADWQRKAIKNGMDKQIEKMYEK